MTERPPRAALSEQDRERERAKQRAYTRANRATCTACGGPMGVGRRQDGVCRPCRQARAAERRDRIAEMWDQGVSIATIADELAIPAGTVKQHLAALRRDGRAPTRLVSDEGEADRIVALWAEGASLREIGDALGITATAAGMKVQRLRRKGHDLPHRNPPR